MNKKQLVPKIKGEFEDNLTILSEDDEKVEYEVCGFKGVYNKTMTQAPLWAQELIQDVKEIKINVQKNTEDIAEIKVNVQKNTKNIERIMECPTIKKELK